MSRITYRYRGMELEQLQYQLKYLQNMLKRYSKYSGHKSEINTSVEELKKLIIKRRLIDG